MQWVLQLIEHHQLLNFFSRGQAFNIPGQLVDGMDVLKVSKATEGSKKL